MADILALLAENEEEEEVVVADEALNKRIADKVAELDSLLVEIHGAAAIEERGLSSLLRHLVPTCYFLNFLLIELSSENLLFYLEVEHYKKKILNQADPGVWRAFALKVFETYIKQESLLEINIISPVRDAVKQALSPESLEAGDEGLHGVFDACQRACYVLMLDTWKRFITSQIYSGMMAKLRAFSVNDFSVKKESIRLVLEYFQFNKPRSDMDDIEIMGGIDPSALIKEKTLEFLRRSNVFNNPELDPDVMLKNWDAGKPQIVKAIADYAPIAYDNAALPLTKGDLILVDEVSDTGTWKGRKNGTGPSGTFPSNLVESTNLISFSKAAPDLDKLDGDESYSLKSLMPRLFKSIVQSCCQIIHTAQPPVASWVLDGLIGTIISVSQVVGASDSLAMRIYTQKDVRWLNHCSTQVVSHLKTLIETIHKAYVTSDTRSRASNPNYLSPISTDKTLSVITDLIRSTKELAFAATPIINGFLTNPQQSNVGLLMKVLSERATIVDLRHSLDQSQTFLMKSIQHLRKASEHDDLSYLLRSATLLQTACLQIIEAVSGLNQLDQQITQSSVEAITAISRNCTGIQEQILKIVVDHLNKSSLKEPLQKVEKFTSMLEKNSQGLLEEISKIQNVNEASLPESGAAHSDTEPVDEMTKALVMGISEFVRSVHDGRKSELLIQVDHISDMATKLGSKIVFDLKNLGISGIKRLDELKSDAWDLVAGKAALSKTFSALVLDNKQEDLEAMMKNLVKELAQSIMALLPGGELVGEVSKRKQAMSGTIQALKTINNLTYRVSDLAANPETKKNLRTYSILVVQGIQRIEFAVRDASGLIPSADSVSELKSACTNILGLIKQLSSAVYAAIAEPDFGGDTIAEESEDMASLEEMSQQPHLPISPFDAGRSKPVSPFDAGARKGPVSPFDSNRTSVAVAPAKTRASKFIDRRASTLTADSFDPVKNELNMQLGIIAENINKIKGDATLAAGVWPPPHVFEDVKTHCQSIAKAIKALLASFQTITTGERDRKEKELAQQLGHWKTYRLTIHSNLIALSREIFLIHEKKQAENAEERRQYQIKKQEKHQTPSKVWIEKSVNTDYEKWYKGFCTEEILRDPIDDIELDATSDRNDPKPANVKGGSLYGLVRMLTFYKYPDPDYTYAFLMSYRSFTTSEELLSLFIERYNLTPPEEISHPKQLEYYYVRKIVPIRMRVSNVIRTWLEDHFEDFIEKDGALLNQLTEFMDNQMQITDDNLAQLLKKTFTKKLEKKEQAVFKFTQNPPEILEPEKFIGETTKIINLNPLELARQLTLIDYKVFSSIQPKEFLNQSWSKEALKSRAPNLRAMIKRSNDLTYFVATELLMTEDLEARQKLLGFFIQVAEKCYELNSFNCVLAIYSGLTSSPIHRLKKTWAILESRENAHLQAAMKKLEEFTDSSGNHAKYRSTLHSINPPCVPFLGQYLTDLVFIDDGNADTLHHGDKSFINFQKRMQTAAVIREVQQFQQTPYNFRDWIDLIKYLLRNSHLMDDGQLYKQSLKVEPRAKA